MTQFREPVQVVITVRAINRIGAPVLTERKILNVAEIKAADLPLLAETAAACAMELDEKLAEFF